jgi:hypothetical protein
VECSRIGWNCSVADGVTGPMDPLTNPHDRHDLLLIAAHASGDLAGRDLAQADELVASCPDCALLYGDLRAIVSATAALPTVERPRDFRLTPADAARLRPAGWRRAVGWLRGDSAARRGGALRPLAIGLTTLGLVGLVFSATPLADGLGGSSASVPQALDESAGGGRTAITGAANDAGQSAEPAVQLPVAGGAGVDSSAASAAASAAPPAPQAGATAAPAQPGGGRAKGASGPSAAPSEGPPGYIAGRVPSPGGGSTPVPAARPPEAIPSSAPVPVLALASLGLLVVGLALFAVARARSRAASG